jgi:hypothetical protein
VHSQKKPSSPTPQSPLSGQHSGKPCIVGSSQQTSPHCSLNSPTQSPPLPVEAVVLALEEAEELLELEALLEPVDPVLAPVLPSPPSPLPVLPVPLVELAGDVVLGLDDDPPSPELPPAPPSPEPELSPPAPLEVAGVALPSAQAVAPARAHTARHRARDRAWGERSHIMDTNVGQLR